MRARMCDSSTVCRHHPDIVVVSRGYDERGRLVVVETTPCWRCQSFIRFSARVYVPYRLIFVAVVCYLIAANVGRWL